MEPCRELLNRARRAGPALMTLAAALAVAARAAPAPHKTSEVNATNDPTAIYSQASIAINPADSRHIVAASNMLRLNAPTAVFVSRDRGASYARSTLPTVWNGVAQNSALAPIVAFDHNGVAYCSYLLGRTAYDPHRVAVAVLPAGKTAWEGPFSASGATFDDDKPGLAVDTAPGSPHRGRLYTAWNRNNPDDSQNVYVARSQDGRVWQPPVRVDDPGSSGSAIYATPATGPNGEVYVVWNDYAPANGGFLKFDRSLDGGVTFGTDVTVTDLRLNLQPNPDDPYSIYPIPAQPARGIGATPSIGVDTSQGPRRGWIYVCYADRAPGRGRDDIDIFVRRSTDRGQTWSAPTRVNDDAGANSQFLPQMSVDPVDGSVNVAYHDAREDPANRKAHLTLARSRDGALTFEANARVTSAPSDQSSGAGDPAGNDYGDNIGLSAFGGQVACAWTDNRSGGLNQVWAAALVYPASPPAAPRQTLCGVGIPAGSALAAKTITLSASLTGPAASLVAEWEVKPAGAPFNGTGTTLGPAVAYVGAAEAVSHTVSGAGTWRWRVRALRADGLGAPGAWTEFGGTPSVTLGAAYTLADAARALRVAGGLSSASAADMARVGTPFALTGQPCDAVITLADALAIARVALQN